MGVWQLPSATQRTWCWWFPASCRFRSGIPSCTGALARPSETPSPTSSPRKRESKSFLMLITHSSSIRYSSGGVDFYTLCILWCDKTLLFFVYLLFGDLRLITEIITFLPTCRVSSMSEQSLTDFFIYWLILSLSDLLVHFLTHLLIWFTFHMTHCYCDSHKRICLPSYWFTNSSACWFLLLFIILLF